MWWVISLWMYVATLGLSLWTICLFLGISARQKNSGKFPKSKEGIYIIVSKCIFYSPVNILKPESLWNNDTERVNDQNRVANAIECQNLQKMCTELILYKSLSQSVHKTSKFWLFTLTNLQILPFSNKH